MHPKDRRSRKLTAAQRRMLRKRARSIKKQTTKQYSRREKLQITVVIIIILGIIGFAVYLAR